MTTHMSDTTPVEEPLAALERQLMKAYIAGAGQDYESLVARNDEDARRLLAEASQYVVARLSEMEARLHYLRHLRGQE